MTDQANTFDLESASMARIDATRAVYRTAAGKCAERGATAEEVTVAAAFAAFDLAELYTGPGPQAVEWLRTALDVIERALLAGDREGTLQ